MKFFIAAIVAIIGIVQTVRGVSVVVKDNKVFVNDKPVELTKQQIIKDTDLSTTYELHSGESTITITKSKVGNAISVQSIGPMTEEEKEKMKKMQEKISKEVEEKIQKVQEDMNKMNQQISEDMEKMQEHLNNMFRSSFF